MTCENLEQCESMMQQYAEEAADKAVQKTFAVLGVDINVPKDIEEFRDDLRFGRLMRRAADRSVIVMVSVIAAGFVAALWIGLATKIKGGG